MALDRSVLSELSAALKSGEVIDLVREAVRLVCQELIEGEATAHISAGLTSARKPGPPSATGTGPGRCLPKGGDIELGIPKLRKGSFFPSILEPRRRIEHSQVQGHAYVPSDTHVSGLPDGFEFRTARAAMVPSSAANRTLTALFCHSPARVESPAVDVRLQHGVQEEPRGQPIPSTGAPPGLGRAVTVVVVPLTRFASAAVGRFYADAILGGVGLCGAVEARRRSLRRCCLIWEQLHQCRRGSPLRALHDR